MDYKVFLKETQEGPHDWDIALAVQYKNYAAMDGLTAKNEAIRDKIMGGKQQAQQVTENVPKSVKSSVRNYCRKLC